MSQELILIGILVIVVAEFLLERTLDYLNSRHWEPQRPDALREFLNEEEYQRSKAYARAKGRISTVSSWVSFGITLAMLLGGFALVDEWVSGWFPDSRIGQALAFFGVIGLGSTLISLPFEWRMTFGVEEEFGFNKMDAKTFIADKVKGGVMGALIGGGLLALFIYFYEAFPQFFWLYAWIVFMLFAMAMMAFYTNLIVPWFNKLKPLEDGELREAIEAYAERVNFPLKRIMIMDGSKRSTKGNAFFSGLGGNKNIVLFDTLVEKHDTEELVAILAHEVGHYKKKHTLQGLALSGMTMFLTLFLLGWLIDLPELSLALGADEMKLHLGMISFFILYSPLSVLTGLLMNIFSRKNEYEADRYAATTARAKDLIRSLKRLSVDHLSNLRPHPAYVFFHYSHPPLIDRLAALRRYAS